MMAPHYERARMLFLAVETATRKLGEPIDGIEVTSNTVLVWAGRKRLAMKYYYADSYGPDGVGMPGGGQWVIKTDRPVDTPRNTAMSRLSRLRESIGRVLR